MNAIVTEILSDANALAEKVIAAQTGLPAGLTDPILVKAEGAIEGFISHIGKHPALSTPEKGS